MSPNNHERDSTQAYSRRGASQPGQDKRSSAVTGGNADFRPGWRRSRSRIGAANCRRLVPTQRLMLRSGYGDSIADNHNTDHARVKRTNIRKDASLPEYGADGGALWE